MGIAITITTRGGKQIIDPHMVFVVEGDMRKKDYVAEASGQLGVIKIKESELSLKFSPYLDFHHHFHRDW